MPYLYTVTTDAPPEKVLSAISRRRQQRPLPIPPAVAKAGISGVVCSVRGTRLKLFPDSMWESVGEYELVGQVEALGDGTTCVRTAVRVRGLWWGPLSLVLFAAFAFPSAPFWAVVSLGLAVVVHARGRAKDGNVSPETSPEAKYLVDSLTAILQQQLGAPATALPSHVVG